MNESVEKVLAVLDGFRTSDEITYSAYSALYDEISLLDDLLKEYEPVKPIVESALVDAFKVYSCGNCQTVFHLWRQKYCAMCGRAVKWGE